jgi:hypothetical protein
VLKREKILSFRRQAYSPPELHFRCLFGSTVNL